MKSIKSTFEKFSEKSRKMEDFIFHFLQKTGYLWLPHTGYLTSYLRVEVTRGHQKKNMPKGARKRDYFMLRNIFFGNKHLSSQKFDLP